MAQAKFQTILTATSGLNTVVDPVRLAFDPKTGITELSQAVNIDIDRSGRPSRRLGRTLKDATAARCGFASGETCLFVAGTALYQMREDYTFAALRSDLTTGARMRYWPIAGRIYYTNGSEKGYIHGGRDHVWEKGSYAAPGETRRQFSDPPSGHIVSWFASRALIARDNAIFPSEPSFYGVFNLHNFRLTPSHITMLQPTPQGLWVGTTDQVLFYRGTLWEQLRREVRADYGVLENSDIACQGEKLGRGGRHVLFTTPQGICSGGENGEFVNETYNKLSFPAGRYASAAVIGERYVVLIQP